MYGTVQLNVRANIFFYSFSKRLTSAKISMSNWPTVNIKRDEFKKGRITTIAAYFPLSWWSNFFICILISHVWEVHLSPSRIISRTGLEIFPVGGGDQGVVLSLFFLAVRIIICVQFMDLILKLGFLVIIKTWFDGNHANFFFDRHWVRLQEYSTWGTHEAALR